VCRNLRNKLLRLDNKQAPASNKTCTARMKGLIKTVLERALEPQRTKGTAEELLRLYLIGKRLYYTPAEELLRLR
jgi:hypothetical protein